VFLFQNVDKAASRHLINEAKDVKRAWTEAFPGRPFQRTPIPLGGRANAASAT
jgi:hypothetical protein